MRQAGGLTQEELAEAAGLAARSVRDLERGRRERPQRHTVQRLVMALGLADAAALLAVGRSGQPLGQSTDVGATGCGLLGLRQDRR
ncbi:helix-turn-helix domain-containing protein [Streptomyces sp. 1222.5]|uniref:helix-turn-helix domain-containing protein n=1 Tax=Streptomyces sp. 1222.5 TaxID=1881026 RepID=UPI003D7234E4